MNDRAFHDLLWCKSRYDKRVHAFPHGQAGEHWEAVCTHSVPMAKLVRTEDGAKCLACVLIIGDHLARKRGDSRWS
ncbi:hypothetical protein [Actinokineospora sp.]|uniref:hypothetical protein n=1 Tax=Actinokineospora sp. TaxID=1872133 RepID=UPI003D6BFC34